MANLLKFFRSATMPSVAEQNASIGSIWFDTTKNVIKVRTAENGVDADWEVYGTSPADLTAAIGRIATLEGAVKTLNETTLPALKAELEKAIEDAVAAEAAIARKAEEDLGKRIDAVVAASVSVAEKADGHVTVSKATDEETGAVVYTVAENDIASAKGLADEIKRATDEEARIAGLVATEQGRAEGAEKALADRLDVIEGEGEGSIKKALADAKAYTDEAKAAVIGDATEAGNTLGKLEDRIETIVANEKTYSIAKVTEGLGENVKEAYKLVDEDGTQVGETISIYKDSSLISVDLVDADASGKAGQYIKYTYVLANGTESVQYVDVSRLLVEAEFKNGLEVSQAGEVSVKVASISEDFLTVTEDGLKLSGVQDAIDAAKNAAIAEIAPAIAALDAEVTSTDGAKVTVKVTEVDGVITAVNVTENDIASAQALATLDAEVQEHEQVVAGALNDLNGRMVTAEGSIADHETRLATAEGEIDALQATVGGLDLGVKTVKGQGGEYVTVTPAEASKGDVTVSVSVATTKATNTAYTNDALATDGYVEEQAAAAVATAASDATSKANTAESNAKTYADNLMSWVVF